MVSATIHVHRTGKTGTAELALWAGPGLDSVSFKPVLLELGGHGSAKHGKIPGCRAERRSSSLRRFDIGALNGPTASRRGFEMGGYTTPGTRTRCGKRGIQ